VRALEAIENRIGYGVGWHGPGGTVLLETRNEHSLASKLWRPLVQRGGKAGKLGRLHSVGLAQWANLAAWNVECRGT
jgi:hypothetical protein